MIGVENSSTIGPSTKSTTVKSRFRDALLETWVFRGRVPLLRFPIPLRLPGGGWFLTYGDYIGFSVFCRSIGHLVLNKPSPGEVEFVLRFLGSRTEPVTVVDAGANQGLYSIVIARRLGAKGKVVAFEPAPTQYEKLKRNLRLNSLSNVTIEQYALGSANGVSEFHERLDHQGSYSSLRAQAPDVTARERLISVRVTTLDSYAKSVGLPALCFVKIDAEGGELDILKGSEGVINSARPLVLCEMSRIRTAAWGYRAADTYDWLTVRRYSWFSADRDGFLEPSAAKPHYVPEENLIAIPDEKLASLSSLIYRVHDSKGRSH